MIRTPNQDWPEALATVLTCKYQFGAGRALAFGVPSSKHFLITFNYEAGGKMQIGQMLSAVPLPQGHLFPVRFDPERPHENSHGSATAISPASLVGFGIAGSIALSLFWWLFLHGCSS